MELGAFSETEDGNETCMSNPGFIIHPFDSIYTLARLPGYVERDSILLSSIHGVNDKTIPRILK